MRYHGNYCGPGWSDGKYQDSVVGLLEPIDEFDETCKVHDAAYASNDDLRTADLKFAKDNIMSLNPKRVAAGLMVGAQGIFRANDSRTSPNPNIMSSFRGAAMPSKINSIKAGRPAKSKKKSPRLEQTSEVLTFRKQRSGVTRVTAPAGISTQFRPITTVKTMVGDGVCIKTTILSGRASAATQGTVPQIVYSYPLTPLSTNNAEIQQMCQLYEQFRINSITLHFHPYQGTSSGGEVMLIVHEDAVNILPNSDASTFYSRALSGTNAVLTPLWCPVSLTPSIDTTWKLVDSYNASTIKEFTSGFVYMLTDGTTSIPGYLAMDIDLQFANMKYNPRNIVSGSYQGPSVVLTGTLTSAVSAAGTNFLMTFGGAAFTSGDIYHTTFNVNGSTPPTGTTFGNLLQVSNGGGTAIPYVLRSNSTLFARALTTITVQYYLTWDAANAGTSATTDSECMEIATLTSAVGSFVGTRFTQLQNATAPSN
jgi:hypothetical protein